MSALNFKPHRYWCARHYRPVLAYAVAATLYAMIMKFGIEPIYVREMGVGFHPAVVPMTANFWGALGAIAGRWAWFDRS